MKLSRGNTYIYEPRSAKVFPCSPYTDVAPSPTTSLTQKIITRGATQRNLTFDGSSRLRRGSAYSTFGVRKSDRIWKAMKQKRIVRLISLLNAILSWIVTMLGYFVISTSNREEENRANEVKIVIAGLSAVQAALVALKWRFNEDYMSIVRSALKLRTDTVMGQSPLIFERHIRQQSLRRCLYECAFHMVVFAPYFKLQFSVSFHGINSEYSLDEALFIIIAARNYHTLQLLYWFSKLSEVRTHLFSWVIGARVTRGFIFRCYLVGHPLRLVITVMFTIVIVPGIIEYTFANVGFLRDYYTIWSEYWVISITQAPVGYGDASAGTLFGEFSLLISCFTGISLLGLSTAVTTHNLDLNLTECNLYSELLYSRSKARYQEQAARLLQKWWKLLQMRKRRMRHTFIILGFYTSLREYRRVITKCQKVKDSRFERQIDAISNSTRKTFRPLNEYLCPVRHAYSLVRCTQVQDVLRREYQLNSQAWKAYRRIRRMWKHENRLASSDRFGQFKTKGLKVSRGMFSSGQQSFARARQQAVQNVKGRLVRGVTCSYLF